MARPRIIIVCTFGAGSSQLLKMNVESAMRELGVTDVRLEVVDTGSFKSIDADGIITTTSHAEAVKGHPTARAYAAVKGTFNTADIKEKVEKMLRELDLLED